MTGSRTLASIVVTTLSLVALAGIYTLVSSKNVQTERLSPLSEHRPPTSVIVQLRAASSNEALRLIELDDQNHPRRIRIEWNNGLTCLVNCDENGRPQQARMYEQSKSADLSSTTELSKDIAAGLSNRAVVRKTTLGKDGLTVTEETLLDPAQTIRETAIRLSNGDFVVNAYGSSSNLEAIRTYDRKSGDLIGETVFEASGNSHGRVLSTLSKELSNRVRRDIFSKSGGRTKSFVYDGDRVETVIVWQNGGDLIAETIRSEYSRTTRSVYENGRISYDCQKSYNDYMVITHYDKAGYKLCKQEWKSLPKDFPAEEQGLVSEGYYLAEIEELTAGPTGDRREITFYPGGKNIKTVRSFKSSGWLPHTDKTYNPDGTLVSFNSQGDGGSYDTIDRFADLSDEEKAVLAKDDPDAVISEVMKKIVSLAPSPSIESFNPPARGKGRSPFLKLD
jgi:hypothetical protein